MSNNKDNVFNTEIEKNISARIKYLEECLKDWEIAKTSIEKEFNKFSNSSIRLEEVNENSDALKLIYSLIENNSLALLTSEEIKITFEAKKIFPVYTYREVLERILKFIDQRIFDISKEILVDRKLVGINSSKNQYEMICESLIKFLEEDISHNKTQTKIFSIIGEQFDRDYGHIKSVVNRYQNKYPKLKSLLKEHKLARKRFNLI